MVNSVENLVFLAPVCTTPTVKEFPEEFCNGGTAQKLGYGILGFNVPLDTV